MQRNELKAIHNNNNNKVQNGRAAAIKGSPDLKPSKRFID